MKPIGNGWLPIMGQHDGTITTTCYAWGEIHACGLAITPDISKSERTGNHLKNHGYNVTHVFTGYKMNQTLFANRTDARSFLERISTMTDWFKGYRETYLSIEEQRKSICQFANDIQWARERKNHGEKWKQEQAKIKRCPTCGAMQS